MDLMESRPRSCRVYEANHLLKAGIRIWPEMLAELFEHRGLAWRMVVREISVRYKQSFLGVLWAVVTPVAMTVIFVWAKKKGILPISETSMPYASFVFVGQMIWLLFSGGLMGAANSLAAAGGMLTKINFPREVLVLSALGNSAFEFIIRIPLVLLVFLWTDFTPHPHFFFAIFTTAPLLLLVVGLGFFLALSNALVRDVGNILGIFLNLGMFATPVIYPPLQHGVLGFLINCVNPVSPYITAARDLAIHGRILDTAGYVMALLMSVLFFFLGWRIFHLVEPLVAEKA